ncbi:hypothetical protein MMC12_008007 [Toensbergia leucococca]|nr:hypothetical protein [Toensbergia leucococca]
MTELDAEKGFPFDRVDRLDHVDQSRPQQPPFPKRSSVSFASGKNLRPHPTSRMSTHRPDHSTTNYVAVLEDSEGGDGLSKLSLDYFNSVIEIFKDKRQHESPVVLDFMLLHQINIHHLEHLLLAEWYWLNEALSDDVEKNDRWTKQSPERLSEIQRLLHEYSVAVRDFEEMRKRPTLDESLVPLVHSSWHEKLLHLQDKMMPKKEGRPMKPARRLSSVIKGIAGFKDDLDGNVFDPRQEHKKAMYSADSPACRQLAGVEDWVREFLRRRLDENERLEAAKAEETKAQFIRFKRFMMAIVGGIALIGPMLVMALVPGIKCSLITTSLATVMFALFITYYTEIVDKDIVVATAGYAAVLVVFVGTSTNTCGQNN